MNTKEKLIDIVANSLVYLPSAARLKSQEIASLAGISQPGVHHHFKKLDDLYEKAYARFLNKYANNGLIYVVLTREKLSHSPFMLWAYKVYGDIL